MLQPHRGLRSRLHTYPRVLIAILAKQKEKALPLFLRCIEELDYAKSSIVLYVRTNNNTDRTEQILRDWIERVGPCYAAVEFDAAPVEEPVETFGQHEWNATRFRVLGDIRNTSLSKTSERACDFYFVCDVDNFIRPCTLRELVALKLPIVAPLLRVTDPNGHYSNFFAEIDPNGFYGHCDQYGWILERRVHGVFEVPLVHCTYLIRADVIPRLSYLDGSNRYEFVVFSDTARKAGIQQYIDNRQLYGYLTFDAESDAAKGIVGERRHDQIAIADAELARVAELDPSPAEVPATLDHVKRLASGAPCDNGMEAQTITVIAPDPAARHSAAFSGLAETIFYGLRHLGHEAFVVSRPSDAAGRIIALAAFFLSDTDASQLPASTIIYNTEVVQQLERDPRSTYVTLLREHEVWDYNRENARRIAAFLSKPVRYVPFGFVPELARIKKEKIEDIDVLFYGELNPRREAVIHGLEAASLNVKHFGYEVRETERDAWIARSKVVLNMHYHQPGVFEIARVGYLLANSKAVVTECDPGEVVDPDLFSGMAVAAYDGLVEACRFLVADDDRRHAIEQGGFAAFQKRVESDILRVALEASNNRDSSIEV
jgi:glycosyltransferase involved in cell wall biosynthesis